MVKKTLPDAQHVFVMGRGERAGVLKGMPKGKLFERFRGGSAVVFDRLIVSRSVGGIVDKT